MKIPAPLIYIGLAAAAVGCAVLWWNKRGDYSELTGQYDSLIVSRNDTVRYFSRVIKGKSDTTALLVRLIYKKNDSLRIYEGIIKEGATESAFIQEKLRTESEKRRAAIAAKTDAERRLETYKVAFRNGDISAIQLRDSLSGLPVFSSAQAEQKYLELVSDRNMWRDSTSSVFAELGKKKREVEIANQARNLAIEANQTVRIKLSKLRKRLDDGVAENKGIFRGGKRKVYKKASEEVSELENELNQ